MDVMHERCAGMDVHKRAVTVCVRGPDSGGRRGAVTWTVRTFAGELIELADRLAAQGVTVVAMEATGVYWKPVWAVLEDRFELLLVNPHHVRMLPGRKTDVNDAQWLAQLLEVGLLRGSFIPPPAIRELRDLCRYRKRQIQALASESQRIDKTLEDTGIKIGSVASKTLGVSSRAMIEALCAGERDPEVLADLARGRLRAKHDDLVAALVGHLNEHHALLLRMQLGHVDDLGAVISQLDKSIEGAMEPFTCQRDRLVTIPGVAQRSAEAIIAEIGVDMTRFPTAGHLASWAGVCPGNNESAGKRRAGTTQPGNRWLMGTLIQCAHAAARTNNTHLKAQYWSISRRRGPNRAAVAVAHSILVSIWHMLTNDTDWADLGVDYYDNRRDPKAETRRLTRRLEALGHHVELTPTPHPLTHPTTKHYQHRRGYAPKNARVHAEAKQDYLRLRFVAGRLRSG